MKTRYTGFSTLVLLVGILSLTTTANAVVEKGPYLIYEGVNTAMTVLWQLDGTQQCTITWGLDTSYGLGNDTTTEYGSDNQHAYTITDLVPGTKYYYNVAGVGSGSFTTAPAANATDVKFLAYGDTRSYPADHDAVNAEMITTYTIDQAYQTITLHVGDWVNAGEVEDDWTTQFFNPDYLNTHEFQQNMPLNGCIGNHEGNGLLFEKYFPYPYYSNFYWSFDYGPVHIAVVDQYTDYSPGSAQHNWLVSDISNSTKQWNFIVLHEPGWSAGGHPNNADVQNYIQPLCETYGVDIVFGGHNHYYARCVVNGVHHLTTGGGGAPLTTTPDQNAENLVCAESAHQFCEIDILGDTLVMVSRRVSDGDVIDSFTVSHGITAALITPADNGPDDFNLAQDEVTVNTMQPVFQIQLTDFFEGIDDATVTAANISMAGLTLDTDYLFGYDEATDIITLTSKVTDFADGTFIITVSGISDMAVPANVMMPKVLTVVIDTSIVPPEILTFQQDVNGYTGAADTMIRFGDPDVPYGSAVLLYVDSSDAGGSGTGPSQVLLQFNGIFGEGVNQIPFGSQITSATLRLRTDVDTNAASNTGANVHQLLLPWVDTVTWSASLFNSDGVDADDVEAISAFDDGVSSTIANSDVDLDVTITVQAWADGDGNYFGWVILPIDIDGWDIISSEGALDDRPELIVEFVTSGNRYPVADAGNDQTIKDEDGDDSELVQLDGSASSDPDGTIASYEWWEGETLLGSGIILENIELAVGIHYITLLVIDNEDADDTDQVVIAITVNQVPVAQDDAYDTTWGTELAVDAASGVLANDSDPDDDTLSAELVTGPTHGSFTLNPDGSFSYTPDLGYVGVDSFTYTANDGSAVGNEATVTITINAPGPTTLFSDGFESGNLATGGWTSIGSVLVKEPAAYEGTYGVQIGGPAWIVKSVSTVGFTDIHVKYARKTKGLDTGESLTVEWSPDGITWNNVIESTQDTEWLYQDVVIALGAGAGENTAFSVRFSTNSNKTNEYGSVDSVEITGTTAGPPNLAPIADSQNNILTDEDVSVTITLTASDPEGISLTYTVVDQPANGELTGIAPNLTYAPNLNFNGRDNFTFKANDGFLDSALATVSITINALPDPPEITSTAVITASEDVQYIYNVVATDPDFGDTLTYSLTTEPLGMAINPTTGVIQWTPTIAHVGADNNVKVIVSDGVASDTQEFTIAVTGFNHAPVITSSTLITATEDTLYIYDVDATDPDAGDALNFSLTTSPLGMTIDSDTGVIQWTPTNEQVGDNDVTVRAEDTGLASDSQSFTIMVTNTNDAPEITSTAVTTATEGVLYSYVVDATDPDGDTLTYSLTTAPDGMTINPDTGAIQWTPATAQIGDNDVTILVEDSDLASDSRSFSITVSAGGFTVHVADIAMTTGVTGRKYFATANVTIYPVLEEEVTVTGDWYFKGALRVAGATAKTDTNGIASFTSFDTPAKSGDEFMFIVTNIDCPGYTYDPALNIETSDSINVP